MQKVFVPEDLEFSTLEKVRGKIKSLGLPEPAAPKSEFPVVPPNLHEQGGDVLVDLFHRLEAWYSHVSYKYTLAALLAAEWKNNLALITRKMKKDGRSAEEIELDEAVVAARKYYQTASQEADLLEAHKGILDRRMKMVSRVITILDMEQQFSKRTTTIGGPRRTRAPMWPYGRQIDDSDVSGPPEGTP